MMSALDIIIVNWNSGNQLVDCVNSVLEFASELLGRIIIVDNASADNSISKLPLSQKLQIINSQTNLGFAKACNLGAKYAKSDFLLFLNPDAKLMANSLEKTLDFLRQASSAKIGICGICLLNEEGVVQHGCARFPTWWSFIGKGLVLDRILPTYFPPHFMVEFDHKTNREVDQVIGAFFIVRRSAFDELGGFDERFFVYFEELDFCLRAKKSGWLTFYFAEASAYHKGGGVSEQVKAHRLFYYLKSQTLFCFKHLNFFQAASVLLIVLLPELAARLGRSLLRASFKEFLDTIKGYCWFVKSIPQILKVALK